MPTLEDARAFERERQSLTSPSMPTLRDAQAFHSERVQSWNFAAAEWQSLAALSSSSGTDLSAGSRLESRMSKRRQREAFAKQWWINRVVAKGKINLLRAADKGPKTC